MNLDNLHIPAPPKLDMPSGKSTGENAKKRTDTDSELWQRQQEHLAVLRRKFCEQVKANRGTPANPQDVDGTFRLLAYHIHVADWASLLPVFHRINELGPDYHRAIIVLGGWHHSGEAESIDRPQQELLAPLRRYRAIVKVGDICRQMAKDGKQNWGLHIGKLRGCLKTYRDEFPEDGWEDPDRLLKIVEQREPTVEMEIENALLFLHPRIFAFGPTSKNPTAGWNDFLNFLFAYCRLVPKFRTEWPQYYWGIYPS